MLKRRTILTPASMALLFSLWTLPVLAAENRPGMEEMEQHDWRQMEERLRLVEEELARRQAAEPDPKPPSLLEQVRERVGLSGLVEVEAFSRSGFAWDDDGTAIDRKESDIILATVELDLHAELNDWARTHILLLWEEDATEPMEVDEAVISLGNPEKSPFFLNAGKLFVPFGVYASYMIQDPLTLELGETNETAVQVGFEHRGFFGSAYAFNGDVEETGSDDTIAGFGASAGYAVANDTWSANLGIDYISNLAEAEATVGLLHDDLGLDGIRDQVAGLGVHLHLTYGPFTLYSEYVGALDEYATGAGEPEFAGQGAKPAAWHLEAAYTREVFGKVTTLALAYQGTAEAVAFGLPETRYLAGLNVALTENLFWSLEYAHDEDYGMEEGGTGGNADMITTQLTFEF